MGVTEKGCTDMEEANVRDLVHTVRLVIARAYEVAALLLRIDEYFYVKELAMVHKQE